jgi:C-terminal processing protease CtpA/Prc
VTARDGAGSTVTTRAAGVLAADRTRNTNPVNATLQARLAASDGPTQNVSLSFVSDPDIAYLRIRVFDGAEYPEAVRNVFRTLRDRGTGKLILDLRGNGGGVDQYGALLVSHLTDRPFRYFDRIHVATIRPSFAMWKPSTFDALITLPTSRLALKIPMYGYWNAVSASVKGRGTPAGLPGGEDSRRPASRRRSPAGTGYSPRPRGAGPSASSAPQSSRQRLTQ